MTYKKVGLIFVKHDSTERRCAGNSSRIHEAAAVWLFRDFTSSAALSAVESWLVVSFMVDKNRKAKSGAMLQR